MKGFQNTFVRQQGFSDCGVACLASILKFYGTEDVSLERLREISGTTQQGTTLLGLFHAACQLGFKADGLKAKGLSNLKDLNDEPAILHVVLNDRVSHFIVFYGIRGGKFVVGDPANGVIAYTENELDKIWESKMLLKLSPNKELVATKARRTEKRRWILSLLNDDFSILSASIAVGVIVSILGVSTAIFSQRLIDNILPKSDLSRLIVGLVLIGLLLAARAGLNYIRGLLIISQAQNLNNRVINKFYSELLRLPKRFFDSKKTGELVARMNDTRRIQTSISILVGNVVIDVLIIIVSIVLCFTYSTVIGVTISLGVVTYCVVAYVFNKPIMQHQREVMSNYAFTESSYIDSIQGISTIKSRNKEPFFQLLNQHIYGGFQTSVFNLGRLNIRFSLLSELVGVLVIVAVFASCAAMVLKKTLTPGGLVAVISLVGGIIPSLVRLIAAHIQVKEAQIAFERMYEFTSVQPENRSDGDKSIQYFGSLDVRHVSFSFPGRAKLLDNISFKVSKGETILLLGDSGCGKSTLLELLQKFYIVDKGEITVNDCNINEIDTLVWRDMIGVVPQEIKVFNGNVLYNICLSDKEADLKEALALCEKLGLHNIFSRFPLGYATVLGEGGINISGGQKQVLGLARALFHKPQLLLLDEPTSAMDKNMERIVLDILRSLKMQLGIIFVTHRISAAQNADRVYAFENGTMRDVDPLTPDSADVIQEIR